VARDKADCDDILIQALAAGGTAAYAARQAEISERTVQRWRTNCSCRR